jgi:hypothetical protein
MDMSSYMKTHNEHEINLWNEHFMKSLIITSSSSQEIETKSTLDIKPIQEEPHIGIKIIQEDIGQPPTKKVKSSSDLSPQTGGGPSTGQGASKLLAEQSVLPGIGESRKRGRPKGKVLPKKTAEITLQTIFDY